MNKKFILFSLVLFLFESADAQHDCWPTCGNNQEITLAFRARRPSFLLSGTDACREEARKLIAEFDREDQNLPNFARTACAALNGWVEVVPGTCGRGGPLCCPANPSHWRRDNSAWSRFKAEQSQIGDKRKAQVEAVLKRCDESTKNRAPKEQKPAQSTTTNPSPGTSVKNNNPTNRPPNTNQSASPGYSPNASPGFPNVSTPSQAQQQQEAARRQEAQQRVYQEELIRKEEEKKRLQNQIDTKAQMNLSMQQLGNDLNAIANRRMLEDFGKDVKLDQNKNISNPLSTNGKSSNSTNPVETKMLTKNAGSLDDFTVEEPSSTANKKQADKITSPAITEKAAPVLTRNREDPAWKKMYDEAYQKFLQDVKKDPELKKKGTQAVRLPNGELIIFQTPENKRVPRGFRPGNIRTAPGGVRG